MSAYKKAKKYLKSKKARKHGAGVLAALGGGYGALRGGLRATRFVKGGGLGRLRAKGVKGAASAAWASVRSHGSAAKVLGKTAVGIGKRFGKRFGKFLVR